MDQRLPPSYEGLLVQPKNGPTVFEVAERLFGRRFGSDTELWKFVNTDDRDLQLNLALLGAGWRCQRRPTKKILLKTADRLFQRFMDKLAESNRNTRFAYFVEEVIVFGSFLRREERVTDIDYCVSYCQKTKAMVNRKIRGIMRRHDVNVETAYKMSLQEIGDFLTAKHPVSIPQDEGTIRRMGVPYKVVYRIPQIKKFVRLIAATEDQISVRHLHEFIADRGSKHGS
jgi:predicted nucleotidyltransferase